VTRFLKLGRFEKFSIGILAQNIQHETGLKGCAVASTGKEAQRLPLTERAMSRMRALQELLQNANKASVLDNAIENLKNWQTQLQMSRERTAVSRVAVLISLWSEGCCFSSRTFWVLHYQVIEDSRTCLLCNEQTT
jgi:hypothetical protein